jgi:hypothetical protein
VLNDNHASFIRYTSKYKKLELNSVKFGYSWINIGFIVAEFQTFQGWFDEGWLIKGQ